MRLRAASLAVLGIVVLASAAAVLLARISGGPDGLPDVNADWTGKMTGKVWQTYDGEMHGKPGSAKMDVSAVIQHEGSKASMTLTLHLEEGDEVVELWGYVGDGHLWMRTSEESVATWVLVGHVSGKDNRIAATVLANLVDEGDGYMVAEFKVSLKRLPPPAVE